MGHGGRRVRSKEALAKNRRVGASLAAAAYTKKAPKGFSVYRRQKDGHFTIYKQDTRPGTQDRFTIGYRGTRPSSGSDLYQDYKLTMGAIVPRSKQLAPEIDQFLKNHPNSIVSMAGHSLGSHLALDHFSRFKGRYKNLKNSYLYALPGTPLTVGKTMSKTRTLSTIPMTGCKNLVPLHRSP